MAYDPVASRYAQALFETATAQGQVDETLASLSLIGRLIEEHAELQELFFNPDVDPDDKVGVLERSLKGAWPELARTFVHMVVAFGRAEYLPQIVEALQAIVDEAQGRLRVVVRSAHPLSHAVAERLRRVLERREGKHVELAAQVDPELIGGLQVFLDHRVIDSSVRRNIRDLYERFTTVRVH